MPFSGSLTALASRALTLFAALLALFGVSLASLGAQASTQRGAPQGLALKPCHIEHPAKLMSVEAQCGTLSVPENAAKPAARTIALYVARVPAVRLRKSPDPVFVITGGPGQASTAFYASVSQAFTRINRDRDIVIVDQRGTGRSRPLDCQFDEAELTDARPERAAELAARCRDQLLAVADLTQYTTSAAVRDLDAVRRALGYERVNLYGVSYGTRVAQHFARRYPAATRAVILDGVVSPELVLGPSLALDAEAALARILKRCAADAACTRAFGDPSVDYRALRAALAKRRVPVTLADPATGANKSLEFGPMHLSAVLRLASYSPEQAALLPLALKTAHQGNDYRMLAAQFLLIARGLDDTFFYGMHNSVACSEDVPFIAADKLPRKELDATHMGAVPVETLIAMCKVWPRGVIDDDLRSPFTSKAAALLMSGSDDPVTPPQYASAAQRAFADSFHLIVPGFGHGQLGTNCVDRIMAAFIAAGSAQKLDTSCTQGLKPTPFFLSTAGPAP